MSDHLQTVTCQRCGCAFAVTDNYRDFLGRRGVRVVVPLLCTNCFLKVGSLPKQHGEVKWFNARKRYGFIVTEEGEEAFFHERQILEGDGDGPHQGQRVRFHLHYPIKGPEALNVELIGEG